MWWAISGRGLSWGAALRTSCTRARCTSGGRARNSRCFLRTTSVEGSEYGEGISKVGELIDLGVKAGVVEKSGAWYSHGDERIGQGRENAKQFLRDNPDVAFAIEDRIRASHGLEFGASEEDSDDSLTEE